MKKLMGIAAVLLAAAGACSYLPAKSPPDGLVIVYGDSLIEQAKPYLYGEVNAYGGTALCDWVDKVATEAATVHPRLIVLSFIGNNFTSCMSGYTTPEQVQAKYAADIQALKQRVGSTPLMWVLNPRCRDQQACATSFAGEPAPNRPFVVEQHVDAGAVVEGPNGEYLAEYRLTDGVHLNDAGARRFANAINASG